MKAIIIVILLIGNTCLFAQSDPDNGKMPGYEISLTTINGNVFKGLLTQVKDTSLFLYPGSHKDWKANKKYAPVEMGYHNIQEISLKRKISTSEAELNDGGFGRKRKLKFHINANRLAFNQFKKQYNETSF